MRGDRPLFDFGQWDTDPFTPHARGSTQAVRSVEFVIAVYPACAGIDRASGKSPKGCGSLPRMRGDRPRL